MTGAISLVVTALAGTALLVLAVFAFGFSQSALIATEDDARTIVAAAAMGVTPTRVALSKDKRAALVACLKERLFLVLMMGDGPVVRLVQLRDIVHQASDHVQIDFRDVGFPPFDFQASDTSISALFENKDKEAVQ
jgi:hypothetical protein